MMRTDFPDAAVRPDGLNSLGFAAKPEDTRVVVAMSGGVDSSVVAALLKEQGYDVVGITLQLYDHGMAIQKKGACCAGQDIYDAAQVAERIGIAHYVLDYESRFREAVIDEFADSYIRGETPIPCVRCNQTVKFRDLLSTARDLGARCLATGHYVQRIMGPQGPELHAGADAGRDQSYFLFATTGEQLDFLRFPLGALDKDATRALAARYDLPVADKPDSQDICFVPSGKYVDLIERLRPGAAEPGEIVHLDGSVIGSHKGIIHYTIGQRRGIGVGGTGEPLYVVRLEPDSKRVIVGPQEAVKVKEISLRELNWLGAAPIPAAGIAVAVRVRSTRPPVAATLYPGAGGDTARVVVDAAEAGVSPGQACVIYQGPRVLGGGWIDATRSLYDWEAAA